MNAFQLPWRRTHIVLALHNQPHGGLAMRRSPTEVRGARYAGGSPDLHAGSAASIGLVV
jgi:hypothetical protein